MFAFQFTFYTLHVTEDDVFPPRGVFPVSSKHVFLVLRASHAFPVAPHTHADDEVQVLAKGLEQISEGPHLQFPATHLSEFPLQFR